MAYYTPRCNECGHVLYTAKYLCGHIYGVHTGYGDCSLCDCKDFNPPIRNNSTKKEDIKTE